MSGTQNVIGVIAEYNPMHNGHIHHLACARQMSTADFVVAVMSGDFVQRGAPAILDKWTRARAAVEAEGGADLVLELPFAFACTSAENFARGGVSLLSSLGVVTHLAFGAESGLSVLSPVAEMIAEPTGAYKTALRSGLDAGLSYAAAQEDAVRRCLGEESAAALRMPNNILAVQYLRFLREMEGAGNAIEPVAVPRKGGHHDGSSAAAGAGGCTPEERGAGQFTLEECSSGKYPSGEAVRRAVLNAESLTPGEFSRVLEGLAVPDETRKALSSFRGSLGSSERVFDSVRQRLLTMTPAELAGIYGVYEGMENRILQAVRRADSMDDLIKRASSKRVPYAAVSRMFMQALAGFRKDDLPSGAVPKYARVLAANGNGRKLLRKIGEKHRSGLTVLTNVERDTNLPLLDLDIRAADLYNLAMGQDLYANEDHVRAPFFGE